MKKMLVIVCAVIPALIIILYFVISTTKTLQAQITVNATRTAIARKVLYKDQWQLWWPGQKLNDTTYQYLDYNYVINKILLNGVEITIVSQNHSMKGFLQFEDYGIDSTQFKWSSNYLYSSNPINRFSEYLLLTKAKKNLRSFLKDFKKYFDNPENVYGMKIRLEKITQSSLISVKDTFQHYPTTPEVYKMIQQLENYILKLNGKKAGFPMLHVQKEGPEKFVTMAAIPTTDVLPSENKILLKQMVLGSPILVSQVRGGFQTVINGERELSNYVTDHRKLSPAISFQSLVTDRQIEPDTTRWITKLYYPIF